MSWLLAAMTVQLHTHKNPVLHGLEIPNFYGFMPVEEHLSGVCQGWDTQYLSSVASSQDKYFKKQELVH